MSMNLSLLSVDEACNRLSISKSYFYMLLKRGEIRVVKLGRRTLVPEAELQRYLALD
jgi:excisionase family DNA binding protein